MRAILLVLLCSCGASEPAPIVCKADGPTFIPPVPECEVIDCRGVNCDTTCQPGTSCGTLDCRDSPQCRLNCEVGATCEFADCTAADVCFIDCHGTGTTCEVGCKNAGSCDVSCRDGAQCVLDCGVTESPACGFGRCAGGSGIVDCGGGLWVCNRACP